MMQSTGRTRIKICGIRDDRGLDAAVEAGADAVGFVFAKKSPRFVDPDVAAGLTALLPPFMSAVGLFVDQSSSEVARIAEAALIDIVQLHGAESAAVAHHLSSEFTVIKAIQFGRAALREWGRNTDIDLLLVDGSTGGEGTSFDWSALAATDPPIEAPLILAGGLTAANVESAIRQVRPYAVDVSSGVERERGVKDPDLIRAFCRAVRRADEAADDSEGK